MAKRWVIDFAILGIVAQLVKGRVWINPEDPIFTPSLLKTSPPILLWEASNQTVLPSLKFTNKTSFGICSLYIIRTCPVNLNLYLLS